jgi:hypothetical protein
MRCITNKKRAFWRQKKIWETPFFFFFFKKTKKTQSVFFLFCEFFNFIVCHFGPPPVGSDIGPPVARPFMYKSLIGSGSHASTILRSSVISLHTSTFESLCPVNVLSFLRHLCLPPARIGPPFLLLLSLFLNRQRSFSTARALVCSLGCDGGMLVSLEIDQCRVESSIRYSRVTIWPRILEERFFLKHKFYSGWPQLETWNQNLANHWSNIQFRTNYRSREAAAIIN